VFNTADGVVVRGLPDVETDGGVRLRVSSVGICSTDLWVMRQGPSPFVVGHEFAGYLDDGTLAAAYPLMRCHDCDQCARGAFNRCRRVFEGSLGLGAHGGMCDELMVSADTLVVLPESLRPEDAGLVEPFAVAIHALERIGPRPGRRIAVVGGGAVGLTLAAVARHAGHDVSVVARHRHQIAAAEQLGLSVGVGGEYDVVVDAAGTESGLNHAAELLAPGATLLLLGIYPPAGITFPALALMMKEAHVLTSTAYCFNSRRNDFTAAAEFLAGNPGVIDAIVTHRYPLGDAPAAFDAARDRAGGTIKVVVNPTAG
jgi:2-desacetyl-2-hydroxyethyl bacteriochlorophyllide A dehydrogenase